MNGYYYGWGLGGFREVVAQMAQYGFFDVLLPFILVFAVIYAILEKLNIFKPAINAIVAIVIAFFTISNSYVAAFFIPLFAHTGIAIAILLVVLILVGLALKDREDAWKWVFGIAGGFLVLVILGKVGFFTYVFGYAAPYWLQQNMWWIIMLVIIAALIAIALIGGKEGSD